MTIISRVGAKLVGQVETIVLKFVNYMDDVCLLSHEVEMTRTSNGIQWYPISISSSISSRSRMNRFQRVLDPSSRITAAHIETRAGITSIAKWNTEYRQLSGQRNIVIVSPPQYTYMKVHRH